ncbi:hypothetical protein E2562_029272 [Oryza meyeriana var. granulata]|uniref:Uncharacterized protein n=1 Tax=Oryza meyeriana var. granulata TaxID=110450 RepID=A0A6G1BNK5_9ORYZ|nr:hypothetical protein E2562_029272 [Oryza meyeriana var. granulata]
MVYPFSAADELHLVLQVSYAASSAADPLNKPPPPYQNLVAPPLRSPDRHLKHRCLNRGRRSPTALPLDHCKDPFQIKAKSPALKFPFDSIVKLLPEKPPPQESCRRSPRLQIPIEPLPPASSLIPTVKGRYA